MKRDDPFRFCIYCGTDCYRDEPEHTAGCPSSTHVFPAEALLEPDADVIDAKCMDCDAPFMPGDSYTLRGLGEDGAPVYDVICLGCAAHEALA